MCGGLLSATLCPHVIPAEERRVWARRTAMNAFWRTNALSQIADFSADVSERGGLAG